MAEFAKGTTVSAAKSRAEIEEQLERFGADGFMSGRDGRHVVLAFKAQGRQIMFRMTTPDIEDHRLTPTGKRRSDADARKSADAEDRRMWRALALSIKAKLVGVSDGIETFEQAFMAHVVMPDGLTLGDHVTPKIAAAYDSGEMPALLPSPSSN